MSQPLPSAGPAAGAPGVLSWPDLPAAQQPQWPDQGARDAAVQRLRGMPPLVFAGECDLLKGQLALAARGQAFVLQGGDCAETFDGVGADAIRAKLKTVLQMAIVLTYGASMPVVKVGRIAGQYGKPRSSGVERRGDTELPAYRGDMVNALEFTADARRPDPARMVEAYHHASATLNLVRAFTQGGYADLRQVHAWNQDFVRDSPAGERYEQMAGDIDRALSFMQACGADPEEFRRADLYAGHEALVLDYEKALTRIDSRTGLPYDVSGHFLWVGDRTRQLDGAHMEFIGGINNPVGVKVGPNCSPAEVVALCERLNPDRLPGRLTLITRLGYERIGELLPAMVRAVEAEGHVVVWACDPMHGNTFTSEGGRKTRRFDDILSELRSFFDVHRDEGTWPGGVHVELTGDDVTECLGGAEEIFEGDLDARYTTTCDPRLNARQSLDLAFRVAEFLRH